MTDNKYSFYGLSITFEIFCQKGKDWPIWTYSLPHKIISDHTSTDYTKEIYVKVDVADDITSLSIFNLNKSIIDSNQILSIQNIWINDIKIDVNQLSYEFTFYPQYSKKDLLYAKLHNMELPTLIENSDNTLYYNGEWRFTFQQPFFIWYRNKLNPYLATADENYKTDFFGQLSVQQMQRLKFFLEEFSK